MQSLVSAFFVQPGETQPSDDFVFLWQREKEQEQRLAAAERARKRAIRTEINRKKREKERAKLEQQQREITKRLEAKQKGRTIIENIWLGSRHAASNQLWLKQERITAILNVSSNVPCYFLDDETLDYLKIKVADQEKEDLLSHFEHAAAFIHQKQKVGGVLVHCRQGLSRSPSMVIAYLMKHHKLPLRDAYALVLKQSFGKLNINDGFKRQLMLYEQQLFDTQSIHLLQVNEKRQRKKPKVYVPAAVPMVVTTTTNKKKQPKPNPFGLPTRKKRPSQSLKKYLKQRMEKNKRKKDEKGEMSRTLGCGLYRSKSLDDMIASKLEVKKSSMSMPSSPTRLRTTSKPLITLTNSLTDSLTDSSKSCSTSCSKQSNSSTSKRKSKKRPRTNPTNTILSFFQPQQKRQK